ncbi:hypothetical protein ACODT3_38805 [Streptomyces sp. 4.24]|uniref:hypothetical protein n=1 Tax=Streptomyces tritrimontium TaxID=3406573 RepID=UPI003BB5FDD7
MDVTIQDGDRETVVAGDSGLSAEAVARHTRQAEAEPHFVRAERLAPEDLTVWRGTMPLRGLDPMGDGYVAHRTALTEAGTPIHRPLGDRPPA